tara:strand:- start:169 stop:405 length:237 start_codon:yes stop_codon:yes gene_type:complete
MNQFTYHASNGTEFNSEMIGLDTGINVKLMEKSDLYSAELRFKLYSQDLAEMISYHSLNILPTLTYFRGYTSIAFTFI